MLFDLQSRGRKTVVKVIYLGLAILMGGGLVLFGVGTGVPGSGLLDVFSNSGADTSVQISDAEKRANREVRADRKDPQAWADLARARFQTAGVGENYDESTETFTESGRAKLAEAAEAWQRYLVLEPKKPDPNLARLMSLAYAEGGLNQPDQASTALEIFAEAQPSAAAYSQLAAYAYLAGQMRKGDLAADKAVELAPKNQRETLERQLETQRREILRQQAEQALGDARSETPSG
jgi:hypothetical protein